MEKIALEEWFSNKVAYTYSAGYFSRAFLLMDQLWHVPYHTSEIGEPMLGYLQTLPNFFEGVKDIVTGLWKLSTNSEQGAGAVFYAQKGL